VRQRFGGSDSRSALKEEWYDMVMTAMLIVSRDGQLLEVKGEWSAIFKSSDNCK